MGASACNGCAARDPAGSSQCLRCSGCSSCAGGVESCPRTAEPVGASLEGWEEEAIVPLGGSNRLQAGSCHHVHLPSVGGFRVYEDKNEEKAQVEEQAGHEPRRCQR